MRTIQPQIDEALGCEVIGAIYDSSNRDDLSEDMLEVLIPDGVQICVGWSANDGAYRITATHGLEHLRGPISTSDPDATARLVEQWVAEMAEHPAIEADSA